MKTFLFLTVAFLVVFSACRKSDFELTTNELNIISSNQGGVGTTTWTSDKEYLLDGFVFVNHGQTLIIEPGTVIRAKTGQGANASALIVARGGRIFAKGTKEKPIIFTCEADDLEGSISVYNQGLWGGLIILGNAPVNTASGEAAIEGIPFSERRGIFGGDDPADFSGELQYVSIRHGGTQIGDNNEINGLTLGGVGNRTKISHIEIISNKDDGLEVFGGTVNLKNIVVAFCGDDAFDFDLGYQGKCQFFLAILGEQVGESLAEHDGGVEPVEGYPYTVPEIYNATFIGSGFSTVHNLISFQDNGAGVYANSIFVNQQHGIIMESLERESSYERFVAGDIKFLNNVFYGIADNNFASFATVVDASGQIIQDKTNNFVVHLVQASNTITDVGVFEEKNRFKIFPDSVSMGNMYEYSSQWYDWVKYKGAVHPEDNWLEGWTLLYQEDLIY